MSFPHCVFWSALVLCEGEKTSYFSFSFFFPMINMSRFFLFVNLYDMKFCGEIGDTFCDYYTIICCHNVEYVQLTAHCVIH